MSSWRLRDYLVAAGLLLPLLLVVVPIAVAYARLVEIDVVEIDVTTGLLTVVLAGCVGFLALDSIPGRWCPVRGHRHPSRFAVIVPRGAGVPCPGLAGQRGLEEREWTRSGTPTGAGYAPSCARSPARGCPSSPAAWAARSAG
jgi:hypothetical protein